MEREGKYKAEIKNLQRTLREKEEMQSRQAADAKMRIQELQSELNYCKKKLQIAEHRANEADEDYNRLLRTTQSSIVRITDKASEHDFPGGQTLKTRFRASAEKTEFFFFDLTDLLAEEHMRETVERDYANILDSVLSPLYGYMKDGMTAEVATKKSNLHALLVEEQPEHKLPELARLFWVSCMQQFAKVEAGREVMPLQAYIPAHEENQFLRWASQERIVNHEEMDGRNVGEYMNDLKNLWLQCEFSEPKCYLWPEVGEGVPFSSSHHSQVYLPCLRKAAKKGDSVRVIFPGLYFVNPEIEGSEPVVKAKVALFSEKTRPSPFLV